MIAGECNTIKDADIRLITFILTHFFHSDSFAKSNI